MCWGNSIAQWMCHRPELPRSLERSARARTSPFLERRQNAKSFAVTPDCISEDGSVEHVREELKRSLALVFIDLNPRAAVGLTPLFEG
jgi:hypothetical protein